MLVKVGKVGAALREKAILAELAEHPFAISLKKTFKDGAHLYFVFEHCPYGTIGDLAATFPDSRMPEHIAAFYVAEIVLLLQHIHSQGVVHRDVKPENILLSTQKHIKVIDFGDAKYVDEDKNAPFRVDADLDDSDDMDERVPADS